MPTEQSDIPDAPTFRLNPILPVKRETSEIDACLKQRLEHAEFLIKDKNTKKNHIQAIEIWIESAKTTTMKELAIQEFDQSILPRYPQPKQTPEDNARREVIAILSKEQIRLNSIEKNKKIGPKDKASAKARLAAISETLTSLTDESKPLSPQDINDKLTQLSQNPSMKRNFRYSPELKSSLGAINQAIKLVKTEPKIGMATALKQKISSFKF